MNILIIYDGYSKVEPTGSVPSVAYHLSKTMVQLGNTLTILERKGPDDDKKDVEYIEGIRFVRLKARTLASGANQVLYNFPFNLARVIWDALVFALKVNSWLKKSKEKFDVFHVHQPFATSFLLVWNRNMRAKTVYTFHGDTYRVNLESRVKVPWYVRLLSPDLFLMRRVGKVAVLNQSIYSKLVASNKVPPGRVSLIGNGIDTNTYRPDIDIEGIKPKYNMTDKIVVLFAGVIFPRKGVEYLIKAANILINQFGYRNLLFLLAGDATLDTAYVSRMSGLIQEFHLEERVKMIGRVPHSELVKLYVASDLLLCPSPEEPFPTVVLEAMACGKPIVGSRVGGMLDQIKDGWNGFLFEPGDERALAEKIRYLVDHPEERKRMGINSRQRAEQEFDWNKVAEKYLEIYRELVK